MASSRPPTRARAVATLRRRAAPVAILAVALLARLWRLGDANVWWDEALAAWAVRKGLAGVTLWTASDVHPPLYFWSLWAWVQAFGESEVALRLLSVLFGVLTVAAVYALARHLAGRWAGAVAGALVAVSRFHVWWSQETRMYVLAGLLGALSLLYLLRWLRSHEEGAAERPQWRLLVPYVLATAGALYTVFLMGALVVAENLVVLAALLLPGYRRRPLLGGWVAAQLAVAAPVAGWLALSWGRMQSWSVAEPVSPGFVARLYATLLATGVSTHIEAVSPWAILAPFAVLGVGLGLLVAGRRRAAEGGGPGAPGVPVEPLALLLAWSLPALAIYLATQPRSLFYTPRVEARYFLPFAPAFWALLGAAVVWIGRRLRPAGWAAGALVLGLSLAYLPGHYEDRVLRDEAQSMVRSILAQAEAGDVVLLDSGSRYPIFDYYYGRVPLEVTPARSPVYLVPPDDLPVTPERVAEIVAPHLETGGRIWLAEVDANLTNPERLSRGYLAGRLPEVLAEGYGHNALYLYDPAGRPPAWNGHVPAHPLDAPLAGGRLAGWELPVRRYAPGDALHLALYWAEAPAEAVRLTLRDGSGRTVALAEGLPPTTDGRARQALDLSISRAVPQGRYTLEVAGGGQQVATGEVEVVRSAPAAPGAMQVALEAPVGEGLVLEGYSLGWDTARAGGEVVLDLVWRAEGPAAGGLVVFTHLLGEAYNPGTAGPVWAGHDAAPAEGGAPVERWRAGERVLDRHILSVDPDAPEGVYRLEVGMYDPATGARLPVTMPDGSTADHLVLESAVRVGRP
jgi:mannosyltransferase